MVQRHREARRVLVLDYVGRLIHIDVALFFHVQIRFLEREKGHDQGAAYAGHTCPSNLIILKHHSKKRHGHELEAKGENKCQ